MPINPAVEAVLRSQMSDEVVDAIIARAEDIEAGVPGAEHSTVQDYVNAESGD